MRAPGFAATALLAATVAGCGDDPPPERRPAQACADEWNERAPAALRTRLDAVATRQENRRVRVARAVPGTALAAHGTCFVAHARVGKPRHTVFARRGDRWRLETPTRPTTGPGPQPLRTLVRRASSFPNAFVRDDGTVILLHRDRAPPS